ncbi:MAG: hypothetical protein HY298_11915 [Verrucomicrobia bacterium]|nr:hypothetical protein [Verrucomicrobiota bacterium]
MSLLWKWLFAGVALVVVAVGTLVFSVDRYHRSGPPAQERQARDITVQPLLQSHATREQVIQALGLEFVDYSVGSTNRQWLERAFSDERVRQGADHYPGVLFHTTALTMTWLFFDAEGRLQDYYLCEQ